MATPENAATGKAATTTASKSSRPILTREGTPFRTTAPEVRTLEELQRKYEQLLDAIEHGKMTPKEIDGYGTTLKGIRALGIDVPMRLMQMVAKYGKGGTGNVPMPRGPMIRAFMGLSPVPKPAEVGRAFLRADDLK